MSRKDKICRNCINYIPETKELEPDCLLDEDVSSNEYCELFEKRQSD